MIFLYIQGSAPEEEPKKDLGRWQETRIVFEFLTRYFNIATSLITKFKINYYDSELKSKARRRIKNEIIIIIFFNKLI